MTTDYGDIVMRAIEVSYDPVTDQVTLETGEIGSGEVVITMSFTQLRTIYENILAYKWKSKGIKND